MKKPTKASDNDYDALKTASNEFSLEIIMGWFSQLTIYSNCPGISCIRYIRVSMHASRTLYTGNQLEAQEGQKIS